MAVPKGVELTTGMLGSKLKSQADYPNGETLRDWINWCTELDWSIAEQYIHGEGNSSDDDLEMHAVIEVARMMQRN